MKKTLLSMLLVLTLSLSLVACGDKKETKQEETGEKKIKVAVVYSGNLGDKSYNDSCNAGAQRAVKVDYSQVSGHKKENIVTQG